MLARRFLINLVFVGLGCLAGWGTAQYFKREFEAAPVICIFIILFFLVISVASAQYIIARMARFAEKMPLELIRHGEIWGWLVPATESAKAGYPISKDRVTIGRDIKNDILLNHHSISREHVEVLRTQDGHLIRDLDSRNGLYINSQRVKEQLLQQGDKVTIGDLEFVYRTSDSYKDTAPQGDA